jgi:hypothetical protein
MCLNTYKKIREYMIYLCACICMYINTCTYVHTYVHKKELDLISTNSARGHEKLMKQCYTLQVSFVYTCIHIYMHTYTYTYIYVYVHIFINIHRFLFMCTYLFICICTHTYIYVYMNMSKCMYIQVVMTIIKLYRHHFTWV